MRRYRRLVLIDRVIPFLAAVVGLIALAGAVAVQLNADAKTSAVTAAMMELRSSVDALGKQTDALPAAANDGTAAGLLALQDRMNRLEAEWGAQKTALATAPVVAPTTTEAPTSSDPRRTAPRPHHRSACRCRPSPCLRGRALWR